MRICVHITIVKSKKSTVDSVGSSAVSSWLGTTFYSEGTGTGGDFRLLDFQVKVAPVHRHGLSWQKREDVGVKTPCFQACLRQSAFWRR